LPKDMLCGKDKNTGRVHCDIASAEAEDVVFDI
jgi:hypothetical protein